MDAAGPRLGPGSFSRSRPGRETWLLDGLLAAAMATLSVTSVLTDDPTVADDLFPAPTAWLVALALAGSLPLAIRRLRPFGVHLVVVAAVAVIGALQWNTGLVTACLAFSTYTVAAWCRHALAVAGLLILYAVTAGLGLLGAPYFADWSGQLATVGFLVVWVLGRLVRRWRREQRLAVQRALEAERTKAVAAERAVFAERLRIARELHDVVSHTLSVIAVQSAVARHLLGPAPGPAGPALTTIEDASRAALDDLRRMLGVLRAGSETDAVLAPSPGLDELDLLASTHRASHGALVLEVDPAVESMPDSIRMTTFRLVQEALTNVRKHAPGAAVRVSVRAANGNVVVQVDDDGPATATDRPPEDSGYGLTGMRERVAMFGGHLDAGPRPDGGFRVRAVLRTSPDQPTMA
jgi:signal transduction histidine kinase